MQHLQKGLTCHDFVVNYCHLMYCYPISSSFGRGAVVSHKKSHVGEILLQCFRQGPNSKRLMTMSCIQFLHIARKLTSSQSLVYSKLSRW